MCKRKLGFMNGRGFTKKKLLEIDKIPFDNMTDDDYMCGRCYQGDSFLTLQEQHKLGKLIDTNKEKHSAIPKKIDTTDEPVLPKGIELKSKEESNSSNLNSASSEDTTKTLSPIGKRDISTNTSRPDMSRLMVASNTLPEFYSLPSEEVIQEFEYGDENNFKTTKVWMNFPVLADGEEILWSCVKEQGVFNKKVEFVMAITNFRAGIWHFEYPEDTGYMLIHFADDVIVMDSHRQSSSHRMGSFHSTGRMGMRIGTHSSIGSSRSQTVGDVHVMKDGETIIRFGGVSDPHGIVKLVKSVQKQVTIRDKVDETKPLMENTYVDNRILLKISELYQQGNEQEAVKMCDDALKSHPDDEGIFKIKLAHCVDTGNWKQMVVDSRNMLLLKDHEPAFEYLMMGLIKLDKTNDAIDELHRGLELFPENAMLLDFKKQLDDFEANNLLDNKKCPKCNKENESDSKFCNKCGAKFDEGCKECGKVNPKNSKFCNDCGASLG